MLGCRDNQVVNHKHRRCSAFYLLIGLYSVMTAWLTRGQGKYLVKSVSEVCFARMYISRNFPVPPPVQSSSLQGTFPRNTFGNATTGAKLPFTVSSRNISFSNMYSGWYSRLKCNRRGGDRVRVTLRSDSRP